MDVQGNNRRDADYRAKKLVERGWTCRECDNRETAASAAAAGLPALEGTEKQVAWANGLRNSTLRRIDQLVQSARWIRSLVGDAFGYNADAVAMAVLIRDVGKPAVDRAIDAMRAETDARFWIDGREDAMDARLRAVVERIAAEDRALSPEGKAEAAAEHEAMTEATLRPAVPVSETIAELSFRDGLIKASYDERSEAFNALVKDLGYRWDPAARCWCRTYQPAMMGAAIDRLAETAHELVAAGIVVALHDPEARAKAIDRSYEPEHRRWVSLVTDGEHKGRFRLTWGRGEDFYREFRGLKGASYRGKACTVPATSRDEVLDFAEAHGFRLTTGAEARAAEVLERRERGLVVDAKASRKAETTRRGSAPAHLAAPEVVSLHDALVDHD
ncbi:hypothetical protein [Methylobacterium indicum]|uniref:Uncharacterized protein n=1 Tax=Methylobacterium indicum TaxID=1775910 RepID=A0A8H8WSZ1_9HYPH|nr:hypothetical protein [Methylobacterium indicum]BCM83713.1 hypothetical protein mvi_21740 [Methylobacterium indicum]